jgi:hypothetical protein
MATSKKKWQDLERFVAFMIDGQRVYAQSAKFLNDAPIAEIANGDAVSEYLLAECKVRDFALGTKMRKEKPKKPADYFRVDLEWWRQIAREAGQVNKLPFLVVNRKFTSASESFAVLDLDTFIQILYKAGLCPYKDMAEVMKAYNERNKENES